MFVMRMRGAREWIIRAIFALLIGLLIAGAYYIFSSAPDPGKALVIMFGVALVVTFLVDATNISRDVWIDEKGFHCFSQAGSISSLSEFRLNQIHHAQIIRSGEIGRKFHILVLEIEGNKSFVAGIPTRLSLENLAQKLHELSLPVQLADWIPRAAGTRKVTGSLFGGNLAEPTSVRSVRELGVVTSIGADQPRLFSVANQILGALMAGWPMLLGLAAVIGGIAWSAWHWSNNSLLVSIGVIVVGCVCFWLGLQITAWWSGPIESGYLLRIARGNLRGRTQCKIRPDDHRIVPVSNYKEESCKKQLGMSFDDGFLVADKQARCLYFEGNKHRWQIPYDAIIEAQVEEFNIGAESEQGVAMTKWFVHLAFPTELGREDYYLRLAHEKFGSEVKAAKQRADDLLLYLEGHLS